MAAVSATPPTAPASRASASDRREALLDVAAAIVVSDGASAVSMETVAEQAGVSRPLVYKHFANREELLTAVYRREASLLHREMAADVEAADSLEQMFRTLLRGAIRASVERGPIFASLRAEGGWNRDLRKQQHERDRRTVRFFAARAVQEYGIPEHQARSAVAILLSASEPVMAQWRRTPTPEKAAEVEAVYMALVVGGLKQLAAATSD